MKLEKQVCSLELAKKLKELGVKQDSHFYFKIGKASGAINLVPIEETTGDFAHFEFFSAYTVAELGEKLLYGERLFIPVVVVGKWSVPTNTAPLIVGDVNLFSEADARALVLIYFLENNLIEINANTSV